MIVSTASSARTRILAATAAVALALAGVVLTAAPAQAVSTITVTTNADAGAGSLRAAAAAAGSGDTIDFSAAVSTIPLLTPVVIPVGVTIDGGGDVVISRGNTTTFNQLVLAPSSGGQSYTVQDITIEGVPSGHGIGVLADDTAFAPANLAFTSVTVRNETTTTSSAGIRVLAATGTFTMTGSTISGNIGNTSGAVGGAGAVWVSNVTGNVTVQTTTFSTNVATGVAGGGIAVEGSALAGTVTFDTDTFTSNGGDEGGGIFVQGANTVLVTGSTFTTNSTNNSGAAAAITNTTQLNVTNSTFTTNTSTGNRAGALFLSGLGGLDISGSTFTGSSAPLGAGAIYIDTVPTVATITGTTFDSSHTAADGGAIWIGTVASGSLIISTSTFTGNSADGLGGAIYADSVTGSLITDSSTFAANESGTFGTSINVNTLSGQFVFLQSTIDDADTSGGVYGISFGTVTQGTLSPVIGVGLSTIVAPGAVRIGQGNSGQTLLLDSILSSSSADIALRLDDADLAYRVTMQYDLDSDVGTYPWILDQGGNQFSVADPMLGALAPNGGPTMTRLPLAGSPAINLGDPAISPPSNDQRGTGFARVSGGRIDIGSVEVQAALAATGSELPWVPASVALLLLISGAVALRFARPKASSQTT